jgi:hypothetical protein
METENGMAQKVNVLLVDDIDGSDAAETIQFGLDGTHYEIRAADKVVLAVQPVFGESLALSACRAVL